MNPRNPARRTVPSFRRRALPSASARETRSAHRNPESTVPWSPGSYSSVARRRSPEYAPNTDLKIQPGISLCRQATRGCHKHCQRPDHRAYSSWEHRLLVRTTQAARFKERKPLLTTGLLRSGRARQNADVRITICPAQCVRWPQEFEPLQ